MVQLLYLDNPIDIVLDSFFFQSDALNERVPCPCLNKNLNSIRVGGGIVKTFRWEQRL